jgi:hypothetical protein
MIDIANEHLCRLIEAPYEIPSKPHISTVVRWTRQGVKVPSPMRSSRNVTVCFHSSAVAAEERALLVRLVEAGGVSRCKIMHNVLQCIPVSRRICRLLTPSDRTRWRILFHCSISRYLSVPLSAPCCNCGGTGWCLAITVCQQGLIQEVEHQTTLQSQCLHDGQNTFDKATAPLNYDSQTISSATIPTPERASRSP